MNLQLKIKNYYFLTLLQFCSETIGYIIIFIFPLVAVAQSPSTLYLENDVAIYGIKHLHTEQITVKNTHKETLYIIKSTPFHADTSLVASITLIQKKEKHLNNLILKTIPSKKIVAEKAINKVHNSKKSQFKYKKNTFPFSAERTFKNSITLVVSASNGSIVLKNKNNVLPQQISNNHIAVALILAPKKTISTTIFQNSNNLKEGIATYKRPPPFLLV